MPVSSLPFCDAIFFVVVVLVVTLDRCDSDVLEDLGAFWLRDVENDFESGFCFLNDLLLWTARSLLSQDASESASSADLSIDVDFIILIDSLRANLKCKLHDNQRSQDVSITFRYKSIQLLIHFSVFKETVKYLQTIQYSMRKFEVDHIDLLSQSRSKSPDISKWIKIRVVHDFQGFHDFF